VANLVNTVNVSIRNDVSIGESIAIGSNLVVGKNIINSGDFFTNYIYAKSIRINDAVIENTVLTNAFIDNVPISSQSLSFISTLSSNVQLQLDTNSKMQGERGIQGIKGDSITGERGIQGIQGDSITGERGIQGIQGESITGERGIQGIQGDSITGERGIQGIQGESITGERGIQGIKGDSITGATGATGAVGSSGASQLATDNTWTGVNNFTKSIGISSGYALNIGSSTLTESKVNYIDVNSSIQKSVKFKTKLEWR
jgi:hypothetical protein